MDMPRISADDADVALDVMVALSLLASSERRSGIAVLGILVISCFSQAALTWVLTRSSCACFSALVGLKPLFTIITEITRIEMPCRPNTQQQALNSDIVMSVQHRTVE